MFDAQIPLDSLPSQIDGLGVFTREPVRKGDVVWEFKGRLLTRAEFLEFRVGRTEYDAIQVGEDLHLVDERAGVHCNHSCDPNLWMLGPTTFVARRLIEFGEELTVDYAVFSDLPKRLVPGDCRCGSTCCRRIIRGDDWQLPELQLRYAGGFSPFLARRMELLPTQRLHSA
ncbi:SET domain-containing protein [Streptomyces sp. PKU-MA01144]|uniref:SET domain-containing protein n=1 Tax=Streptomyces sp. PKU-MA01144 TaxID=2729138 RepID=UPI002016CFD3|nr:SET domain-containing protein [Streptomyces sp. PKU-MA01144]